MSGVRAGQKYGKHVSSQTRLTFVYCSGDEMFSKAQKLVLNTDLTICSDCDHLRLLESQISNSLKCVLPQQMFSVNSSRAAWETFVFAFEEHPQGSCRDKGVGTGVTSISPQMRSGQNMCRCYFINTNGRLHSSKHVTS